MGRACGICARDSRWPANRSASTWRVLEDANLITTVWRGREKLHYLNAEPINAIADRWINQYDRARVQTLADLKTVLETEPMSGSPEFVYTTYINTTPERLWQAITDPAFSSRYMGHAMVSDFQKGSTYTWAERGLEIEPRGSGHPRVGPVSQARLHVPHLRTRTHHAGSRRGRHRQGCSRTPIQGVVRHRNRRRRQGEADSRPRRLPARKHCPRSHLGWLAVEARRPQDGARGIVTPMPAIVDRATWQAEIDALRVREKAHTREGDAIAAARRRLPMVEVDPIHSADRPRRTARLCSTHSRGVSN